MMSVHFASAVLGRPSSANDSRGTVFQCEHMLCTHFHKDFFFSSLCYFVEKRKNLHANLPRCSVRLLKDFLLTSNVSQHDLKPLYRWLMFNNPLPSKVLHNPSIGKKR